MNRKEEIGTSSRRSFSLWGKFCCLPSAIMKEMQLGDRFFRANNITDNKMKNGGEGGIHSGVIR